MKKRYRKVYLVIDGDRILYRHRNPCNARTFQDACGSPTAVVMKARIVWDTAAREAMREAVAR